jgi:hypothetical protein
MNLGKSEGTRPVRKLKRRYENNIKMNLKNMFVALDLVYLAQDRKQWRELLNKKMNIRILIKGV